jgi:proline utilization trans-activator
MVADMGVLNGVSWFDTFYAFNAVLIICAGKWVLLVRIGVLSSRHNNYICLKYSSDFLARPKDQPDSPEDVERKASVRSILQSTRVIKLAPTYNILSQIAVQFAKITGAIEEATNLVTDLGFVLSPTPQPAPPMLFAGGGSIVENSDASTEWFENQSANVPWDFFDMAPQNGPAMISTSSTNFGGFQVATGEQSDVDAWAARNLRGMHNIWWGI